MSFGVTLLVAFGLIALWLTVRHGDRSAAEIVAGVGVGVFVASFVPVLGRALYVSWMGLGVVLGMIVSPIITALLFAILVVPVGLAFRLMHRDVLKRSIDPGAKSYWERYEEPSEPADYLKQF